MLAVLFCYWFLPPWLLKLLCHLSNSSICYSKHSFGDLVKCNMVFRPPQVYATIFLIFLIFSYLHEKVYFGTNWTHQKSMKLPQKTDLHRKLWGKVHGFILFHEGSQGPPTAGRYPHEKVWTHGHTSTLFAWRYDTFPHSFLWRYDQTGTYRFFVEFSR